MNAYYVCIMTNKSRTLYVGMTNDLEWRVRQHETKQIAGFTARYNVTQLAFYESFAKVPEATAAEKKVKGWAGLKKIELIESQNPKWVDLAADWYDELPTSGTALSTPTRHWEERVSTFHRPVAIDERSFGVPQDDRRAPVAARVSTARDKQR